MEYSFMTPEIERYRGVSDESKDISSLARFIVHSQKRFAGIWASQQEEISVKRTFDKLKQNWQEETSFESSMTKIVENENYRKIMEMGSAVVSVIIDDLRESPDHWFYALRCLTKENPVKDEDAGSVPKMAAAWIEWFDQNFK